jgi:hypothetical protein
MTDGENPGVVQIGNSIYGKPIPDTFYKYRSLSNDDQRTWFRQTILEDAAYWATPSEFNDPFDCAAVLQPLRGRELAENVADIVKRLFPTLNRKGRLTKERALLRKPEAAWDAGAAQASAGLRTTAIYSLAVHADTVLMWSHYGDSHHGVCLRFSAEALYDHFTPSGIVGLPVSYQSARPIIKVSLEEHHELLRKAFLVKAKWWEYEDEWRFIHYQGGAGLRKFPSNALTGVVLGARISAEKEQFVRAIIAERPTRFSISRAHFDARKFKLNIVAA